jgi:two-component system response regulator FixJ
MKRQTVYIVDDDAAVCDSIQELVESVGLRAECFTSAKAFLDQHRKGHSGCLVLDVRMAEMSGLVLQENLNAMGAEIPVIIITGHADVPMAVQAIKAGAVDFVQ